MMRQTKLRIVATVLGLALIGTLVYVRSRSPVLPRPKTLVLDSVRWDGQGKVFVLETSSLPVLVQAARQQGLEAHVSVRIQGVRDGSGAWGSIRLGPIPLPIEIRSDDPGRDPPWRGHVWLEPFRVPWEFQGTGFSRRGSIAGTVQVFDAEGVALDGPKVLHRGEVDLQGMLGIGP